MFSKKYIFDIRSKRKNKALWFFSFAALFIFIIHIVFLFYIFRFSDEQTKLSQKKFYQITPDLLAVYTGDQGRLNLALEKTKEYPGPKLFISGVFEKNSLKTLLNNYKVSNLDDIENYVEIDYFARNTIENVISTLSYINKNPPLENILIISSNYHLFRINLILKKLNKNSQYKFYFHGVNKKSLAWRDYKIIIKEIFKTYKAVVTLIIWDE